jgi:inner membrane protein
LSPLLFFPVKACTFIGKNNLASFFGHAISAIALGKTFPKNWNTTKVILLGAICSVIPDADVLAFSFGIPYASIFGHRGITHSILFAFVLGLALYWLFFRTSFPGKKGVAVSAFLITCTLSHGILDALTTGGLGVGFFIPFDNDRYFLPWQVIQVSPIGAGKFFSKWGLKVLWSEFLWIGIPAIIYTTTLRIIRRK